MAAQIQRLSRSREALANSGGAVSNNEIRTAGPLEGHRGQNNCMLVQTAVEPLQTNNNCEHTAAEPASNNNSENKTDQLLLVRERRMAAEPAPK